MTNNASLTRVELQPLDRGEAQLWQPEQFRDHPGYRLYAKISDKPPEVSGVLFVINPDGDALDEDHFHEQSNRLSVGPHAGETRESWDIKPLGNGQFRIGSWLGAAENADSGKWKESRSLEAVKAPDGTFKIRHEITADRPTQAWTFTKM